MTVEASKTFEVPFEVLEQMVLTSHRDGEEKGRQVLKRWMREKGIRSGDSISVAPLGELIVGEDIQID